MSWERSSDGGSSWSVIEGAGGETYTPSAADKGALVRAAVEYIDGQGFSVVVPTDAIAVYQSFDVSGVTYDDQDPANPGLASYLLIDSFTGADQLIVNPDDTYWFEAVDVEIDGVTVTRTGIFVDDGNGKVKGARGVDGAYDSLDELVGVFLDAGFTGPLNRSADGSSYSLTPVNPADEGNIEVVAPSGLDANGSCLLYTSPSPRD